MPAGKFSASNKIKFNKALKSVNVHHNWKMFEEVLTRLNLEQKLWYYTPYMQDQGIYLINK